MPIPQPEFFESFDGQRMAWRELGEGRPVILIHGYFSNAEVNWLKYGHAEKVAAKGFRVIMPDLRGHGDSAKPHDPVAYPPDALMKDGMALVAHLGLTDYDLGGYSLGGRTTMRMLVNGATPKRVVMAGMGLTGVTRTARARRLFPACPDQSGQLRARQFGVDDRGVPENHRRRSGRIAQHPEHLRRHAAGGTGKDPAASGRHLRRG